jgi:hypothetical protein
MRPARFIVTIQHDDRPHACIVQDGMEKTEAEPFSRRRRSNVKKTIKRVFSLVLRFIHHARTVLDDDEMRRLEPGPARLDS